MKTLGLIGGTSWESTAEYYRIINQHVARTLGGLSSAKLFLCSLDFEELRSAVDSKRFPEAQRLFSDAARTLEASGADALVICSNAGHIRAAEVMGHVSIPLIHIADAVGEAVTRAGVKRAGLIGTRQTMELDFLRDKLANEHALEIVTPEEDDRQRLDAIIFGELARGEFLPAARAEVIAIMNRLRERGAGGIVLGCTELPLLIKSGDVPYPTFDTTELHALAAARWSLREVAIV